ncbi:MAG TPA: PhzF family phenazine biosynthesis protein [Solirubrobacteraceae bacterium]|nr:PhzF family phenazine biosynthesis protein [Solirubrobacteraceae bacterium]
MNDLLVVTIVDACLRGGRGGSPTAVLWDTSLSEAERRRVPQLTESSHAVFVSSDDDGVSLRFFTATGELAACGHGTVAALAFLAEQAGRAEYEVTLRAGGRSFVGRATDDALAEFDPGEVRLAARLTEHDAVLDALGHRPDILAADVCLASLGQPRLLVPISSPSALAKLRPDYDRLKAACDRLGLLGCYVHSPPSAGGRLAARMFAPSIGVPEDIANANSTACLAARLAQRGTPRISVDMGDSLGRPATITAMSRATRSGIQIRVGGAAKVTRTLRLTPAELTPPGRPSQARA